MKKQTKTKEEPRKRKYRRSNFIAKLWYILVKDLKILVRSKVSALVFFIGPLVITLLAALAFNTSSLYDIRVAAYSDAYSELSDSVIEGLSGAGYSVVKLDSKDLCVESVKLNDYQVCMVFSPNMVASNSETNDIELYVDNSRVNIADQLVEHVGSKVDVESDEISIGFVRDMLRVLDSVNKEVAQRKVTVDSLSSSNADSLSRLESIADDIKSLDLTASSYDESSVLSDLSGASGNVTDLNSSVQGLLAAYAETKSKLDSVKSKASDMGGKVDDVRNLLIADKSRISALSGSIASISTDIGEIKVTNVNSIVDPISTSIVPLSETQNYFAYIFPALLAIIVMFMGTLMSSTTVIQERKSNAYFRNFISPTSDMLLMIGHYITMALLIAFEMALVLLIGSLFLSNIAWQSYLVIGGILLVEASVFIFLGMLIGYLFETGESVTIAAISLSTVFLFLSSVVLPVEIISGVLRSVVMFNPFVVAESLVKKVLHFGFGWHSLSYGLIVLGSMALGLLILTLIVWRLDRRLEA